jgi:hypothetical protein
MSQKKLLDYKGMAADSNQSERRLRWWVQKKLVPHLRLGHKTVLFEPDKFYEALSKFEVKPVTAARRVSKRTNGKRDDPF